MSGFVAFLLSLPPGKNGNAENMHREGKNMARRERNELLRLSAQLEHRLAKLLPDRAANARGVVRTRRTLRRWLRWVL
ncbi:MAG: hypothetical protein ACUVSP_08950 [Desulfotomaculales bacterium]